MRSQIGKVQDSMESLSSLHSNGSGPMSTPILTWRQSTKQRRELVLSIRLLAITPCISMPFNNRGKGILIHDQFLSSRPSWLDHGNTCALFCLRTKKKTKRAMDNRRLDFDSSTSSSRDSRPDRMRSRIGKVQDSMEILSRQLSNGSSPMSTPILTRRQSPKQHRDLVLSIRVLAITPCITMPFNNRGKRSHSTTNS
jgi:hypothetical protein